METILKYFKLTIFLLCIAAIYNAFIIPINLVAGGTGGLGVLFYKLLGVEPYVVLFFVSALMFFLACIFLEIKQAISTLYIVIFYPLFVKILSFLGTSDVFSNENILTLVLISAILMSFFQGLILQMGFNIGGLSVLAQIITKKIKVSITFVNMIINGVIVLAGASVFGVSNLLYAIVFLIISRIVSERVMLGASRNKTFKIISSEYKKIDRFIHEVLTHDTTVYNTYGAYKDKKRKLIMTIIPNADFMILKDYVKSVDKKAFIFVSDTYEIKGQDVVVKKESVK